MNEEEGATLCLMKTSKYLLESLFFVLDAVTERGLRLSLMGVG